VQPGDTLTAIAARAGMSVAELAAINGIDPNALLISGTALRLSGTAAPVNAAPSVRGSYVVQPGDTLTAIAARAGMSIAELAAINGIDPNAPLLSGTALRLSGSTHAAYTAGTAGSASTQPVGAAAEGSPVGPPYPTSERMTPGQVASIAAANGVSPSLADAIAYQESGFNNAAVSSADARGVMQILPGTWSWIQRTLIPGGPPLAPASAVDNVRGGVLLLRSLLNSTGGDPALAAAGYFQGLPSVERYGVLPQTQQYVNDVMALRQQFGGG
jgi:soluble lytic murein transglycosylase-like protein